MYVGYVRYYRYRASEGFYRQYLGICHVWACLRYREALSCAILVILVGLGHHLHVGVFLNFYFIWIFWYLGVSSLVTTCGGGGGAIPPWIRCEMVVYGRGLIRVKDE